MGFFDKVKEKAGEIADDAGRATKVAQAQMKLKSLQGDVEAAKKELGDVAFQLVAGGELAHAGLEAPVSKIREALALVADDDPEMRAWLMAVMWVAPRVSIVTSITVSPRLTP